MVIHTLDSPATSTKLFGYFCPDMLVLVLLPMLIDYFNGCARACSIGIASQIKIMGEASLVFTGLWFWFYSVAFWKNKIMSWKKKGFEDLKDLLISFRLYFLIARDRLCISTMYYLLL
jgi:hypothetical protein